MLHVPASVGGNPQALARAERELGLASLAVSLEPNPYGYEGGEVLWRPGERRAAAEIARWRLLVRAVREFDVVHFNFGRTIAPPLVRPEEEPRLAALYARLLGMADLPLLRRAGKVIAVTFQGDDARQGDMLRQQYPSSLADEVTHYTPKSDGAKRRAIARFERHADHVYFLNPDLAPLLPERARFAPYAHVDPREWRPSGRRRRDGPPRVVHAPSDRAVKGTRFVLEAVERLRAAGIDFEFRLVEGLPNREARRLYEEADLCVDQLLAGWYGGLAVEAMALATPVVTYIRDEDLDAIPAAMRQELPAIRATPTTVYEVLSVYLTTRSAELPEIGRRSRTYVERWHDPLAVARRLKHDYELAAQKLKARRRGVR